MQKILIALSIVAGVIGASFAFTTASAETEEECIQRLIGEGFTSEQAEAQCAR